MVSVFSQANSRVQPGEKLLTSEAIGWTSLLVETWRQPGSTQEFTTVASPDQTIVLTTAGTYNIEVFSSGQWRQTCYRPGLGGATAPFNTNRIRWTSADLTIETLHVYVPPSYFSEAAEDYRRAGKRIERSHVDALSLSDPLIFSLATSLRAGIALGAPNLHAEAAARTFATHILLTNGTLQHGALDRKIGHDLTDRRLARLLHYMHHHFAGEITLDQLSSEAGISRFHFVRLFRKRLLTTPHRYLIRLRLEHSRHLLRTTDLDINAVALACGYTHAGRFAAAFQNAFGLSPLHFRQQAWHSA